ncbi:hypothetical protein E2562_021591 [Oryza meyeriana var. granulata]|uniref:Uncharacterized protein n=1 Tax=Oryza meyeriana var. granulata TaxID=110450 RepID=A0A6G1EY16_9ORYZ|nr:hypothetical protein E2562_021591 [Oryza meyeriana var. granulata]
MGAAGGYLQQRQTTVGRRVRGADGQRRRQIRVAAANLLMTVATAALLGSRGGSIQGSGDGLQR